MVWDELLSHTARDVARFFQAIYPSVTGERAQGDLFEALEEEFLPGSAPTSPSDVQNVVRRVEWFRDEFLRYTKLVDGDWPFERKAAGLEKVTQWQMDCCVGSP